jgi:CheY-like chemotaxis protein
MQVLVIDDQPDVGAVLQVYCQLAGYETTVVTSVEEAQIQLRKQPAVVFLDWFIGEQRADVLIQDVLASHAKIILMSGSGTGELRQGAIAQHVDYLLSKPFTRQQIAEVLQRFFSDDATT